MVPLSLSGLLHNPHFIHNKNIFVTLLSSLCILTFGRGSHTINFTYILNKSFYLWLEPSVQHKEQYILNILQKGRRTKLPIAAPEATKIVLQVTL